jgi:hypothetical protein
MIPVPPLSETYALLEERGGFTAFIIGSAVTFFTAIAGTAALVARSVCTVALWTALFRKFKIHINGVWFIN